MRALALFLFCTLATASTVTVDPGPGVTVKVNRLKSDTSKTISVTVNKSDTVKIVQPPPPIEHTMHAGIDVGFTGWPDRTIVPKFEPLLTTGNSIPAISVADGEGAVRTMCGFWMFGYFDPIVFPGVAGSSHHHTFYGNTGLSENTTAANIRAPGNGSTCRGGTVNLSGYWHPSLIDTATSKPLAPLPLIVYYKTGWAPYMAARQRPIEPLPAGLRMVSGNGGATGPTPDSVSSFSCFASATGVERAGGQTIPACSPGEWLRWKVNFKQCWNGQLDSSDHKSHLTDPIRVSGLEPGYDPYRPMVCPDTHPRLLPIITSVAQWDIPAGVDYSKLRLSSDVYAGPAGYSGHADWFMGWDTAISDEWSKNCHQTRRDCGSFTLGDGRNGVEWEGN